ncbi:hypothetical protein AArcSl_1762 [Halalkaliarchaeum desulfuricum]|uniref:DUF429 domain-containing protein n=1 Tax=Halalkaliarchaeum desulfuricum TaxID=2055893 RepID=A0A343TJW8_9EURY|nr:DUF429 domain-containing protein [Halalkaliarchaeum desulfuricum]AUX09390.1 hypothetical protein AArcSl_1762 [Halalkaliarchaeum desulfuricum]
MSDASLSVGAVRGDAAWVAVAFDGREFDHAEVFPEIGDLWLRYEEADRILVDVPIGLVDDGDPHRQCDVLAKQVLQHDDGGEPPRESSRPGVTPVREATRKRRYSTAAKVHERKTGERLPEAAFERAPSIAAVDELVGEIPEARATILESRPDVCFRAIGDGPLRYDRRTAGGYAERMRRLAAFDRDGAPTVQAAAEATAGHDVRIEDVLDAVVLGYTARPSRAPLRSLPEEPPTDERGLPMRIVYRAEEPLVDG